MTNMLHSPYLDIAKQGKNTWWRYLVVFPLSLLLGILIIIPPIIVAILFGLSSELFISERPYNTATMILFIPVLIAVILSFRLIFTYFHQRNIYTLINPSGFIRWKHILTGCILWLILQPPVYIISYLIDSSRYSLSFEFQQWLSINPFVAFIVLSLSALYTIILLGYIFQALSLLLSKPQFLILSLGIVFGIINANSGSFFWSQNFILIFLWTSFLLGIILKDNGSEIIIGIFIAIIIFDFIVGNEDILLQLSPIITVSAPNNWTISLILQLFNYFMFYYLCFNKKFLALNS